jgi:DNA replication initiation complex subunit (GINS family)
VYDLLYDAWLKEKENSDLQRLPKDFYAKLAKYVGQIRREGRMLDQKSAKARLISQELSNVKRLMNELAKLRFEKIVKHTASAKPLKREALTVEEERMLLGLKPSFESFQSLLKDFLRGKISKVEEKIKPSKRMLLRFVQEVPAIVGANLKVYGPFAVEDVATLPVENAKVLVKHGVAMEIETK